MYVNPNNELRYRFSNHMLDNTEDASVDTRTKIANYGIIACEVDHKKYISIDES